MSKSPAQPRQALMRAAGHSFSPGTTMLLWTRVGRPLPACWLWLVVDGRYGRHWSCNEWLVSSLVCKPAASNWQEWLANTEQRMTILSPVVFSRLFTRTATPTVTSWVSSTHTERAVLWNQVKPQGVGLSFRQWAGKKLVWGLSFSQWNLQYVNRLCKYCHHNALHHTAAHLLGTSC